jgi:hypothetical protein
MDFPPPRIAPPTFVEWKPLLKAGRKGIFTLIVAVAWLPSKLTEIGLDDARADCFVDDLVWTLQELCKAAQAVTPVSIALARSVERAPASLIPGKRVAEEEDSSSDGSKRRKSELPARWVLQP